jgi:hypothetical protein
MGCFHKAYSNFSRGVLYCNFTGQGCYREAIYSLLGRPKREDGVNSSTRDILKGLADCISESVVRVESSGGRDRLWLPRPPGADYQLYIETRDGGGGAAIAALPNGTPPTAFFWHLPLEYPPDEENEAVGVLVKEAVRLIRNRSRIIQSAGFALWRLRCEVQEGGAWKRVGGTIACIRLFFMPPLPFRLKTWEYRSGPLQSAT